MRIGRFEVDREQVLNDQDGTTLQMFQHLAFIPIRAEFKGEKDVFEYTGISEHFDDIPQGEMVPLYAISVTADVIDNGIQETPEIIVKGIEVVRQ